MDNEAEVIKQQMEETRTSLTDKLETLEQQVTDTVQDATSAVSQTVAEVKEVMHETVDTVKGSVQDTLETVKETFDLPTQVGRHPWAMVGGSVAVGYLVGSLLIRKQWRPPGWSGSGLPVERLHSDGRAATEQPSRLADESIRTASAPPAGERSEPGWLTTLTTTFRPEIDKLKGLAIGAVLGVVRDMITQSAPEQMKTQLAGVVNDLTVKLGGEPIRGPVLNTGGQDSPRPTGSAYHGSYSSETRRPVPIP
jgi:ElaB/YqjD/DUF883 family membrane-anchored ribosome-binding protein